MRAALRRHLRLLQSLTNSKSVKTRSIITDAILYILNLQLQVEAIKTELHYILHNIQEVKVEKDGKKIIVKVACKKVGHQDLVVRIVEALEEMDLSIVELRVSCKYIFAMEAIVEAAEDEQLSVGVVTLAILKTIDLN
nr:uncharacterized protein LOC109162466 [Ipomoea batatas]GMD08334.1 uncharacterized protein LOC109162466 [Ipomoea batatas]